MLLAFGSGQAFAHTPEPPAPPQYTAVDLGTLGGSGSRGVALDRDTVVGNSETAGAEWHAFAYDRSTRVMTDLGTLGGSSSDAVDVQGRHVIGNATLPDGTRRGFVYDLRTRRMQALGTFGGTDSQVRAISGHTVVGSARTPGNQSTHAFVYDIRTEVMTDLGTPADPAGVSSPIGISQGRFVAGTWNVPGAQYDGGRPFVYDLRTHVMTDVGLHGGVYSKATSFSGHTIVGITQPQPSGDTGELPPTHGFAYDIRTRIWTDLGAEMAYQPLVTGHTVVASNRPAAYALDLTTRTMTPFGPGPGRTGINAVGGQFVVGEAFPGPFCYVYRIDTRRLTRLHALGGIQATASGVDRHGSVTGSSATAPPDPSTPNGPYHATLWTLSAT
ncbi:hypothetical protein [Streptomyces sp. SID12488]|uniref:hypothetical protein n=1 Tax=Streptomyces sp. SID12488 TaxID=2706040 RepID=UPI0013DCBB8C|nr:hypothetical protein [Streptomyces sp. SID12488]